MYEEEAELFRTLGDPIRLHILALLKIREACVCELAAALPVSQPAISQHLRRLRQAGLVRERRQKYWSYYRIAIDERVRWIAPILEKLPIASDDVQWLETHAVGVACGGDARVPPD